MNFVFILIFVNVFQKVFGRENSIVGVIFTIMISASMVRDLTATPIRHLCLQTAILFVMATAACFVSNATPLIALGVNFAVIFLILCAFTCEYVSHLYFPYILSYLFLVFSVHLLCYATRASQKTVGRLYRGSMHHSISTGHRKETCN